MVIGIHASRAVPESPDVLQDHPRAHLRHTRRADDFKRGVHRPLPVDEILRDARTVRVPVYEHPFVHEELWGFVAARAREAGARWLPFPHIVPPRELPPLPRHWRNFVTVRDEAGRWLVVRPAQLRVAVASADGADAAAGALHSPASAALHVLLCALAMLTLRDIQAAV